HRSILGPWGIRAVRAEARRSGGRSWHEGDAEHTPAMIVRDVERAVAPHEHVDRAAPHPTTRAPIGREVLDARSSAGRESDPHDPVAGRRKLSTGAMERNVEVSAIRRRKLRPGIEGDS